MGRHDPELPLADATVWRAAAQRLHDAARGEDDTLEQQTLLTLAADCEALATESAPGGQPGKPTPPGNPPRPSDEEPVPIEEPPRPVPPPRPDPPPPLSTRHGR